MSRKALTKEAKRETDLLRNHNLTTSHYNQLLDSQAHKCAICGKSDEPLGRRLYVDHCHVSGNTRGLLCIKCNTLLGQVEDNRLTLHLMTMYLILYSRMKAYQPLPKKRLKYSGLSIKESNYRSLLKCRYGITPELYSEIHNIQEQSCAICGIHQSQLKKKLCIDHDHTNNQVRGLLCDKCNRSLGLTNDNISILHNSILYLQNYSL